MFVHLLDSFHAVPCQSVLDYFRSVVEFNSQLIQALPEEQLTEVRPRSAAWPLTGPPLTGHLSPQDEERQTVFEVCLILIINLEENSHLGLHEVVAPIAEA